MTWFREFFDERGRHLGHFEYETREDLPGWVVKEVRVWLPPHVVGKEFGEYKRFSMEDLFEWMDVERYFYQTIKVEGLAEKMLHYLFNEVVMTGGRLG